MAVHSLGVQINNTTATNDDLVVSRQYSSGPAIQRELSNEAPESFGWQRDIVLSNPDRRLRFPGYNAYTAEPTLDAASAARYLFDLWQRGKSATRWRCSDSTSP